MKKSPKFQKSQFDDQELNKILEKFNDPIIVEGKKDITALRKLGVENKIYHLAGKPLYEFCEKIAENHKSVLVLTDYDRQGKRLAATIADFLERFGVKTNMKLRKQIHKAAQRAHVESFNSGEE